MPQFFDQHPVAHASLTEEAVEAMRAQIKATTPDDFGVKLLSTFVAINGQGYCISEAPDAEAVVKSHEAKGYLIDSMDVIEITSLV